MDQQQQWPWWIAIAIAAATLTAAELPCRPAAASSPHELAFLNALVYLHHFWKLVIWFSPLFVSSFALMLAIAIAWTVVCVQNVIRAGRKQPCFLSNFVNRRCGNDPDEFLRDAFYHAGLKDRADFGAIFDGASLVLLIIVWIRVGFLWKRKTR